MKNTITSGTSKSLEGAYLNGDYEQVIDGLIQAKKKFSPDIFHYNLGTVYALQGGDAAARYHFEKSLYLGYRDKKVLHNLEIVKHRMGLDAQGITLTAHDNFFMTVKGIPDGVFVLLSMSLLLFFLILFITGVIKRIKLLLVGIAVSLIPLASLFFYFEKFDQAIFFEKGNVYQGPSGIYSVTNHIDPGIKIIVGKSHGGWFYIVAPEKYNGWVKREVLGIY
ncbi:MAG: hypothetical protein KAQ98_10725 [Bacteriovoracaceae bacterium]|nr:hypothetical protein [Bacteriovoracaceae bacterium]